MLVAPARMGHRDLDRIDDACGALAQHDDAVGEEEGLLPLAQQAVRACPALMAARSSVILPSPLPFKTAMRLDQCETCRQTSNI